MAPHSAFQRPQWAEGRGCLKTLLPLQGRPTSPHASGGCQQQRQNKQSSRGFSEAAVPVPVWLPHSSRRQWLPNSCARSSSGRLARARAPCARGSPRTLASSICPAATSCGRTSRPTRVREVRGRGAGVNRSGIRLGAEEQPERDRVSSVPGRPSPARVWSCRLLRAGAHAAGGPRPCAGEGRGSLGGGWEVHAAPLSAPATVGKSR